MSLDKLISNENSSPSLKSSFPDSVINKILSNTSDKSTVNYIDKDGIILSNSEIDGYSLFNKFLSKSDCKLIINDNEDEESSSYNTDHEIVNDNEDEESSSYDTDPEIVNDNEDERSSYYKANSGIITNNEDEGSSFYNADSGIVNDNEDEESSSYNSGSGISFTTSPTVLYLHSENQNNNEASTKNLNHDEKRPFTCDKCGKTFKRRSHHKVHLHTHNTDRPHVCKVCNKAFTHHYFLQRHEPIHNTDKQFSCEICNEKFSVQRYYTRHLRRHRSYECDACDFKCWRLRDSKKHITTHNVNTFRCDECDRLFCYELSLNQHQCFELDKKRFFCKLCPKAFRKKDDLVHHTAAHENKKTIICDICNKRFNTKISLAYHMKTSHEKEDESKPKPFSCQTCEKKFHSVANLKKHEKVHEPWTDKSVPRVNRKQYGKVGYLYTESPVPSTQLVYFIPGKKIKYVCGICLKGFRERHRFHAHQRRHAGEKPFKCEMCKWCFAEKCDLKRHYLTHTENKKSYPCDFCSKTFTRKCNLTVHIKTFHKPSLPKIISAYSVNEESV